MSDTNCSRCGIRPAAVRDVCRYCFGRRHLWGKTDTPAVEVPATEPEPVVAEVAAEAPKPKPKAKRRPRKKAD
jgi:hypothetical protein